MAPSLLLRLLAALALVLSGAVVADDRARADRFGDPELPFEVERPPGGVPIYVLGVNRFTPLQLSRFVAGVAPFLRRAEGVDPGTQLVLREEGLRGYLSLSTSPFSEGPAFLMTLRGEPVRTFENASAVLGTVTRLAVRLLAEVPYAPSTQRTEGGRGTAPAYLVP